MTRADLKTLSWLGPLGTLLSIWWMLRSNPCLDHQLGNRWRQWFPKPAAVPPPSHDSNAAVVVENPYGIEACDYWPGTSDHVVTLASWLAITGLIGFLAARNFEVLASRRAALVMLVGLFAALAISNLAYLPDMLRHGDYEPAAWEVGISVALIIVGAGLSASAAWLTLRWRMRVTKK